MQPNNNFTPLTIDRREISAHPYYADFFNDAMIPWATDTLKSGDYSFISPYELAGRIPKVGIELCTVTDLIGKLDGRLSWQLGNMIQEYDVPYLLVHGSIVEDRDGYITEWGRQICRADRLYDILHGAQAHGVIVLQDQNPLERIKRIYQYWHRPCDTHKYFRPNSVVRDTTVPVAEALDERIIFLMGAPGIGEDRATSALAHFGSLLPILCAPVSALQEIPLWGKITAAKFRSFIDAQPK